MDIQTKRPQGPQASDGLITYYGHVAPDNLVTWAVSAMRNSYSPYSGHKEGVLIRTERGDISVGTNVETINWDGLNAVQVAIGRLFVQQPWVDHKHEPERISDIVYALEDFDPKDPDSFIPAASSLEWLKKFGSPDTVLHFATPEKGIQASKTLHDILPYGPRMKALQEYLNSVSLFSRFLRDNQDKPDSVDDKTWHGLRRSRLHAFAPYSNYRVSVVVEADGIPLEAEKRAEIVHGFNQVKMDKGTQVVAMEYLFNRLSRFEGINVEISGNSGLHAEGCAIGAMITDLGPTAKIRNIHLQGGFTDASDDCNCCGKCRQLVDEFSTAQTQVNVIGETDTVLNVPSRSLLPGRFQKLG